MTYCPVAAAEARYNDGRFEYAVEAEVEEILKDEDEIAEIAGAVLEDISDCMKPGFCIADIAYAIFCLGGERPHPRTWAVDFRDAVMEAIKEEAASRAEAAL